MREILFRGKEVKSSDWYYGDIFHSSMNVDTARIHDYINRANVEIIPDTLGQYTGLTDKNGVKIFEGDVVRISEDYYDGLHYSGNEVYYSDGAFCVEYETPEYDVTSIGFLVREGVEVEVIGNIYDNPELIGEDGDNSEN